MWAEVSFALSQFTHLTDRLSVSKFSFRLEYGQNLSCVGGLRDEKEHCKN